MPYRVVVIGAGFAGIGMAIALKRAGIDDFVVGDRAGSLGGTWRDNNYPGLVPQLAPRLAVIVGSHQATHQRWCRRGRRASPSSQAW
jgi:cation diffusion facilitator CzcD-associated flavoprotein CzcO